MEHKLFFREHWRTLIGVASLIKPVWDAGRWIITSLGDLDFIVSRINDPGWVGTVIDSIVGIYSAISPILALVGLGLIYLDTRRHRRQVTITPATISSGDILTATAALSDPPPRVGEKGLHVGFMQIDANKLADDL